MCAESGFFLHPDFPCGEENRPLFAAWEVLWYAIRLPAFLGMMRRATGMMGQVAGRLRPEAGVSEDI